MKKGLVIGLVCFGLILVLSLSFVSASWFGDFWKKITGKVTAGVDYYEYKCNENSNEICYWYPGSLGQSCNEVCASHGKVKQPYTWNDDSNCNVAKNLFGNCPYCIGNYADGRVPNKEGVWCFYRNTSTGIGAMPGVNAKSTAQPICACNQKKISNCKENMCMIYEKIGGAYPEDINGLKNLIVIEDVSNSARYTLRFKINEDRTNARNETTIEKYTPSGWTTVCEEKTIGDKCWIGNIILDIKKVSYTSGGDEYIVFEVVGGKVISIGIEQISCGDGICNGNENCSTCIADCGDCGETKISKCDGNICTIYEKINGVDSDDLIVVQDLNGTRYTLRFKISEDRNNARNETTIDKKTSAGWTAACEEKTVGDECSIGNIVLNIQKVSYTSGGDGYVQVIISPGSIIGIGKKPYGCNGSVCPIHEGETIVVAGHVIVINWMDSNEVVLMVDGIRAPASGKLMEGYSYKLNDGSILKIIEINKLEVSGEVGEVRFEIVEKEENCTDSDGGKNYYVKGQIVGPIGPGEGSNGWDYCFTPFNDGSGGGQPGDTGSSLLEWYCENNAGDQDIINCSNGCVDGACLTLGEIEKNSSCYANLCTIYEKIEGGDTDDKIIIKDNSDNSQYGLRFRVTEDTTNMRNETRIDKWTGSEWATVCDKKTIGDKCWIGKPNLLLTIQKVSYSSGGDEYVTFEIAGGSVVRIGAMESNEMPTPPTCDNGCMLGNKCYPFGYRKSGAFCSEEENFFVGQKEADASCENNFECKSNLCVDGECISGSLFMKIINWFKNLFGSG